MFRPLPGSAVSGTDGRRAARSEPPFAGDERAMLTAFLDFQRATVLVKCAGVSNNDARRPVVPSSRMTLAGLVSHLRWVEHFWFVRKLAGVTDEPALFDGPDPDGDWSPDPDVPLLRLLEEYEAQCARSRAIAAGLELDAVSRTGRRPATLRWVLLHLIEETARHNGHADLVRELLDGETGL